MYYFYLLLGLVFGLVAGSFISAWSYRLPKNISIKKGRSFCPNCKTQLSWKDNIPIFSYAFLHGKCKYCSKEISLRYPFLEFTTGLLFFAVVFLFFRCDGGSSFCTLKNNLSYAAIPYSFYLLAVFICVFVVDLENRIIPDAVILPAIGLVFFINLIFIPEHFYANALSGFGSAVFFILLNLATKGKGMGLGDAKLSLLGGLILGWQATLVWIFLSFILGSIVGLVLIKINKAQFGRSIAFAPFLVVSFIISFFGGESFFRILF